jgi:hypothetical protein
MFSGKNSIMHGRERQLALTLANRWPDLDSHRSFFQQNISLTRFIDEQSSTNNVKLISFHFGYISTPFDTNVTPIIQTHNILTSHNPTPQTHKKMLYLYGFVSQQVTSENKLLWELCWMIFLRLMP